MAEFDYDLFAIGAGSGGVRACRVSASLGARVAVAEESDLGGTCVNLGCIPKKLFVYASHFRDDFEDAAGFGWSLGDRSFDWPTLVANKDREIARLNEVYRKLLADAGVDLIEGRARVQDSNTLEIGGRTITAANILIATGSESSTLDDVEVDEKRIVSSTGALSLEDVPEKLIVIGAGVIGLELGSVWSRLGAEVTFVETLDHILPGMDREISRHALRVFKRQGLEFRLSHKVTGASIGGRGVRLSVEPVAGGDAEELAAAIVLLAIGRRPYTEGLGLEEVGVTVDEHGFIEVDRRFETRVPGIYAIGDCVPGPMLAHKAEDEGSICAEILAGQSGQIDYDRVPGVVYTWPEIASVGKTEEALKEQGVSYKLGKFPFSANSRGRVTGDTDGFVKILADTDTDRVLGVHILGPLAGDLISEAVIAMEFGASAEDIARTCHAHPSMGEAVREAALAAAGRALHI
ncbi:MAG: dihydrolipoyl dehydrogenase [Myxococcales bacterium]|nr:dihydrolipoyl dehydrogenase [Myxococcales bacterium]